MRINPEVLHKLTRDYVDRQSRGAHDIQAIYLHGSLLVEEDSLIAGTGDIDLFFIHNRTMVNPEREIVRLTDEIHFDITHLPREMFRNPKELRVDPWMGPVLYGCRILYDPHHFMDFVQASIRGQFDRSDNLVRRSRRFLDEARQIWLGFQLSPDSPDPAALLRYLLAVEHAANALASMRGLPLTERRFLSRFSERAAALGDPALFAGLLGLLGSSHTDSAVLNEWVESWRAAFTSLPAALAKGRLDVQRTHYYDRFFDAYLHQMPNQPYQMVLWPLLNIWTATAQAHPNIAFIK